MIREDAKHLLEDFVAYLRRSPDRFIDCLTDKDIEEMIQALEEVAIPLIERRIKEEEIIDKMKLVLKKMKEKGWVSR